MKRKAQQIAELDRLVVIINAVIEPGHVVTKADIEACERMVELSDWWAGARLTVEQQAAYNQADSDAADLLRYSIFSRDLAAAQAELIGTQGAERIQLGALFVDGYRQIYERYPTWLIRRLEADLQLTYDEARANLEADISQYATETPMQDAEVFQSRRQVLTSRVLIRLELAPDWPRAWDRWMLSHVASPTPDDIVFAPWRGDEVSFHDWIAYAINTRDEYAARKLLIFADADPERYGYYYSGIPETLHVLLKLVVAGATRPPGHI